MSTVEKMTVHKALCELKISDSRIEKAMNQLPFVTTSEHGNTKISGLPIADFTAQMVSAYQSTMDLIRRRAAIKRAVVKSNAVTTVVVGDNTYTVAEAIEMKNHGMEYIRMVKDKMSREFSVAKRSAETQNGQSLENRADGYIRNLYGTTDMKNLAEEAAGEREKFIKQHTTELVDPLRVSERIAELEKEYYDFITDVDAALSVSNSVTEISISY